MIKYSPYIKIANMCLQSEIVRESYKIYKNRIQMMTKKKSFKKVFIDCIAECPIQLLIVLILVVGGIAPLGYIFLGLGIVFLLLPYLAVIYYVWKKKKWINTTHS